MLRKGSVASRILLPVFLVAALTFVGVSVLVGRATTKVGEDYDRFAIAAAASHVSTILDLAGAELTAARLADNEVVAEAKRGAVIVAVRAFWSRTGLDGVILRGDGDVVMSTLGAETTRAVGAALRSGFFVVDAGGAQLRCVSEPFAMWGWTVITVGHRAPLAEVRPELASLAPLLLLGALALILGLLVVLWRNLRTPVARLVADVESDRDVRPAGLVELDRIGAAVNAATTRLRARTAELATELDRRQQAERALREEEARVRLLLDSTAEGIFGVDTEGICTFCNPAAVRLLGHASPQELLGKGAHHLLHHGRPDGSEYPDAECPVLRTVRSAAPARVTDDVFWRKDGTPFPVEYWSCPVMEDGVLRGAVVGFLDITERTTLEQQLRQSQKMEAVGRLAGGIAHDFNNMLMAVIGHASLARDAVPDGSTAQHDLDQALAAAEKAAGLTRQILAFSRNRIVALAPVDVNELVQGMGKLLARVLGEDIEVEFRLAADELPVMADRAQLEQVFLNLWTNARDAMPDGGRLVVGIEPLACDGPRAAELGLEAPGPYAVITVSDTGPGMDEATRQRVFEPFFTTKELGKGTGLGLSIAYGIVRQHHGQIAVASAKGRGTTFSVYLPRAAGPAVRPRPAAREAVRGGAETLLLAEDNDQVRELARTVLEGAGYRVLVARDGAEALALHAAHGDEIALCLFDVVMPRLGGLEALDALRRRSPGARAILMSGYAPEPSGRAADDVLLLTKPFVPRELLRSVREALDAEPATTDSPRSR